MLLPPTLTLPSFFKKGMFGAETELEDDVSRMDDSSRMADSELDITGRMADRKESTGT